MNRNFLPALGAAALAVAASCLAAAPSERGRDVAATCAACHGTDGRGGGAIPALAGRDKSEIVLRTREIRDGTRPSTIMQQIAKGYSDEDIEAAAAYFAAQKAP